MSINTSTPTARQLFETNIRYIVPPYQRRYVWDEADQWEPLWHDIVSLTEQNLTPPYERVEDPHFLGAVVVRQLQSGGTEPAKREVIDGQQRLTTLQILLTAAEQVLEERGDAHADFLKPLILNGEAYTRENKDFRFKVWPTRHDQDAFRTVMVDHEAELSAGDSQIADAHRFFRGRVAEWLDAADDDFGRRCNALVEVVTQNLNFVVINVDGDHLANTIFETLNARGTPLQAWDLVKNLIYDRSGDEREFDEWFDDHLLKFDQDWWQQESGAGRNRRSNVDLYLNHFLVLRRKAEVKGRTNRDVYRAFSDYLEEPPGQGEKSVKSVGTDFSRLGDTYEEVMLAPRSGKHGQFLHHWRVEGHGVLAPVILWLWSSDVPDQQLNRAVRALDSYFGRRLVCQSSSKDYRELATGLLNELDSGAVDNAGDVTLAYLQKRSDGVETLEWPSDTELRSVLVERQLYGKLTSARVQMVLEAIEQWMRAEAGFADSSLAPTGLSIEHVLPQKWEAHWPKPQGGSADETANQRRTRLIHTIGNLTLVNPKLNSKLKNDPWKDKRGTLKEHSKLYLSNSLIGHTKQWNEAAIMARSEQLAEVLMRVWPGPDQI